ncbi:MAG: hypothetical protein V3T16_06595 [Gemmatimonadales bacterium]
MTVVRRLPTTCGLLATVAGFTGAPLHGQAPAVTTAYVDVNVVDVDQGAVVEAMTLIVAGGII